MVEFAFFERCRRYRTLPPGGSSACRKICWYNQARAGFWFANRSEKGKNSEMSGIFPRNPDRLPPSGAGWRLFHFRAAGFLQIHGSKFKIHPVCCLSQASVLCVAHTVLCLRIGKHTLNLLFSQPVQLFVPHHVPDVLRHLHIVLPDMAQDCFLALGIFSTHPSGGTAFAKIGPALAFPVCGGIMQRTILRADHIIRVFVIQRIKRDTVVDIAGSDVNTKNKMVFVAGGVCSVGKAFFVFSLFPGWWWTPPFPFRAAFCHCHPKTAFPGLCLPPQTALSYAVLPVWELPFWPAFSDWHLL